MPRVWGCDVLREFREFVMRGSVVDMAVGIVIGAAFGRIVTSLVNDIIMPPIGLLLKGIDFANLFVALRGGPYPSLAAAKAAGAPTINYGTFINTIIDFVILAFVIFLLIRQVNRMQRPRAAAPATTRECPYCLSAIPLKATRCAYCTAELRPAVGGA
jgi:large conductance mechanosensitive channel